jgi:hypothetical protein
MPYGDDDSIGSWQWQTKYAYEAFESLHNRWPRMQIALLQIHLPFRHTITSINDPGMWSLLKIRGLNKLSILGPHRCIDPQVRTWLKLWTHKKELFQWCPLGVESPWLDSRTDLVNHQALLLKKQGN